MVAERKEKRCFVSSFNEKAGEYYDYRSSFYIHGNPREVAQKIIEETEELEAAGWTDLELELSEHDYSDNTGVFFRGTRMETQAEADKREADEAKWAAEREERQRREYEALKKKFEG